MVDDLYDAISMVWSWRRPTSEGKATAVAIEPIGHSRGRDTLPLAIAYKSSFGDDRPYRGESFREPAFFAKKRNGGCTAQIPHSPAGDRALSEGCPSV